MDDADRAAAEDLVRFFRALSPRERAEIDALAEADRVFSEDVEAEDAARREGTRR